MDPLSRPVWNSLTTRQSSFAVGNALAVRMAEAFGPFAATADDGPESLAALASLVPQGGEVWLVEVDPAAAPPGMKVRHQQRLVQMVADKVMPPDNLPGLAPLSKADGPEIHALATLTAPGPSHECTSELGRFVGIRIDGQLVAMAGERFRLPGYIEVSGVCTHPDFRGRGYAATLMRHVAARIIAGCETPFLHSYASNTGAIALYEALGFRIHRTITATVIGR